MLFMAILLLVFILVVVLSVSKHFVQESHKDKVEKLKIKLPVDIERYGICPYCFNLIYHEIKEENTFRRNLYTCTNCKNCIVKCEKCLNFAKPQSIWGEELCEYCLSRALNLVLRDELIEYLELEEKHPQLEWFYKNHDIK